VYFYGLKLLYFAMRRRLALYKCIDVSEIDVSYMKMGSHIVAQNTARKYRAKISAADDQ
jgi:hypothetical protein